jgi:hypothetical protein
MFLARCCVCRVGECLRRPATQGVPLRMDGRYQVRFSGIGTELLEFWRLTGEMEEACSYTFEKV